MDFDVRVTPQKVITVDLYRATLSSNPGEEYDGDYQITPKTSPQELETKNKTLKDNITVLSIPYFEVSNTDGTTVIIGE